MPYTKHIFSYSLMTVSDELWILRSVVITCICFWLYPQCRSPYPTPPPIPQYPPYRACPPSVSFEVFLLILKNVIPCICWHVFCHNICHKYLSNMWTYLINFSAPVAYERIPLGMNQTVSYRICYTNRLSWQAGGRLFGSDVYSSRLRRILTAYC